MTCENTHCAYSGTKKAFILYKVNTLRLIDLVGLPCLYIYTPLAGDVVLSRPYS